jgi:hypothetical protein
MTKERFGSEMCDTGLFRDSIQMYLMGIYGIKDDAVRYSEINKVLHHLHKVYIKKMMCCPQQITYNDFKELKQLLPEERAHISVIVMETKKRVEIIYFTKLLSLLVNL